MVNLELFFCFAWAFSGATILFLIENVSKPEERDKREVDRNKLRKDGSKDLWDELIDEAREVKSIEPSAPSLQQEKKVMGFVSAMENRSKTKLSGSVVPVMAIGTQSPVSGGNVPYSDVLVANYPELDPKTEFKFTLDGLENSRLKGVDFSLLSDEDLVALHHGEIGDVSDEGLKIIAVLEDSAKVAGELVATKEEVVATKEEMALLRNRTKVRMREAAAARKQVEKEKGWTWRFWNTLGFIGWASFMSVVYGMFAIVVGVVLLILGLVALAVGVLWLQFL